MSMVARPEAAPAGTISPTPTTATPPSPPGHSGRRLCCRSCALQYACRAASLPHVWRTLPREPWLTSRGSWKSGRRRSLPQGSASLAEVPAATINGESVNVWHYRNAVYSATRALILERWRDVDTTIKGTAGLTHWMSRWKTYGAMCAGPWQIFWVAPVFLRSWCDESEGTPGGYRRFTLFPALRHHAGGDRTRYLMPIRALRQAILEAGQEVEMPEPEKKQQREKVKIW